MRKVTYLKLVVVACASGWYLQLGWCCSSVAATWLVLLRYLSALKSQRVEAEKVYGKLGLDRLKKPDVDKAKLVADVRNALYASKICSYAQVCWKCSASLLSSSARGARTAL